MRKFISLVLCILMCVNVLTFTVSAEEVYNLSDEQETLLTAIGMYDKEEQLSSKITRAEFADMLVKSIFDEPEHLIDGTESFNDVNTDNEYYASIMLLKNLKVTFGDGMGNFMPDEEILANDAIVMAVRFLGYTKLAEKTGYIPFAAQKGISKDMKYSYEETLNRYNALLLVFNVLNTDVSDRFIEETVASSYMKAYRNLFVVNGVVEDDGFINGYGLSEVGADEIVIDGKVYKNETGEKNLYGSTVKGYYKETVNEKPVILALVKTKDNNIITIDAKNFEKFDVVERKYEYLEDESDDETETVFVPANVSIVYNGVSVGIDDGEITVDKMVPKSGSVTLLDNDGDKKYDVLYINEYETFVTSAIDDEKNIIYVKEFKQPLTLKKDKFEIIGKEGENLELADVKTDTVLSVLKALNGDIIRIYTSDYTVSDVIVAKDDDASVSTQNNGNYELSYAFIKQAYEEAVPEDKRKDTDNKEAYALEKIEFSVFYRLYIDVFGDIAYVEFEDVNLWTTGVLVSAGNEARGSIGEDYRVQIYTTEGNLEKFPIAKNVDILYEDNTESREKEAKVVETVNAYVNKNKASGNRLVRYKLNVQGTITAIEFPLALGVEIADINENRLYIIQDNSSDIKYEGTIFQGKAIPSASCKIINIPTENIADEDAYLISNLSDVVVNNGTYKLIAYGTDTKMMTADYFVSAGGTLKEVSRERAFVVSSITEYFDYDKNETMYKLEGYNNATSITYYIEDKNVLNNAGTLDGGTIKVEEGDVIAYSTYVGKGGRTIISKIYVLYDSNGKLKGASNGFFGARNGAIAGATSDVLLDGSVYGNPVAFTSSAGNLVASTALSSHKDPFGSRIASGYVYAFKDGNIMLTTQPLGNGTKYTSAESSGKYVTEVYSNVLSKTLYVKKLSSGKVAIKKAIEADIKPYTVYGSSCSKVVWFGYWGLDVIYIIDEA